MANYLGYEFIDAAEVIVFYEDGTFDAETDQREAFCNAWQNVKDAVIPGFLRCNRRRTGNQTFSRGGSDITGSLVANASPC